MSTTLHRCDLIEHYLLRYNSPHIVVFFGYLVMYKGYMWCDSWHLSLWLFSLSFQLEKRGSDYVLWSLCLIALFGHILWHHL